MIIYSLIHVFFNSYIFSLAHSKRHADSNTHTHTHILHLGSWSSPSDLLLYLASYLLNCLCHFCVSSSKCSFPQLTHTLKGSVSFLCPSDCPLTTDSFLQQAPGTVPSPRETLSKYWRTHKWSFFLPFSAIFPLTAPALALEAQVLPCQLQILYSHKPPPLLPLLFFTLYKLFYVFYF